MNPQLLLPLAMLACPIGMGLVMWWMMKGSHAPQGTTPTTPQTPNEKLAALRAQRQALEAELAETVRIAELEAKRDQLRQKQSALPESSDTTATQTGY